MPTSQFPAAMVLIRRENRCETFLKAGATCRGCRAARAASYEGTLPSPMPDNGRNEGRMYLPPITAIPIPAKKFGVTPVWRLGLRHAVTKQNIRDKVATQSSEPSTFANARRLSPSMPIHCPAHFNIYLFQRLPVHQHPYYCSGNVTDEQNNNETLILT